jgi:hypothetical protein
VLSQEKQIGLFANLPSLKAQRKIDRNEFDGLDYRGIYNLYLEAFGDKKLAQQAQTAFLTAQVRNSCNAAAAGK